MHSWICCRRAVNSWRADRVDCLTSSTGDVWLSQGRNFELCLLTDTQFKASLSCIVDGQCNSDWVCLKGRRWNLQVFRKVGCRLLTLIDVELPWWLLHLIMITGSNMSAKVRIYCIFPSYRLVTSPFCDRFENSDEGEINNLKDQEHTLSLLFRRDYYNVSEPLHFVVFVFSWLINPDPKVDDQVLC